MIAARRGAPTPETKSHLGRATEIPFTSVVTSEVVAAAGGVPSDVVVEVELPGMRA
jgi:hypothetical protein